MTIATYTRYELLRTFRNRRFFLFSLGFPLVLYVLTAGPRQHDTIEGIPAPLYFLSGMVGWGSMAAVIAGGARIAAERTVGWNRQLRITPLRPSIYIATKVAAGYAMATITMIVLSCTAMTMGVHLSITQWATMVGLLLTGLLPFAAIGVLLGHLLSIDSMGPAMGGTTSLFALLGGTWGPVGGNSWLGHVARRLPSFWLTQAGKVGAGGQPWPTEAWIVVVVWTLVIARLALRAYRRDTNRV
jgi:ABC-2 type transport system permease protein